ncbi:MAG TPA: methyltransferase, partial [Chryseosolibacter sp.]|nr:methyltransferase [Chryseosolibacter sp.]
LLADNDLTLTTILPMKLDAFYVSLLSEKYAGQRSKISAFATAFLNASKSNRTARSSGEYSSLIYVVRK